MEARFRVYDAMTQAGITLSEQQQQALVDQIMLTHQLKQAEEDRIETQRKLEQAQQRAADRMTNLFMAATQGGDAFKQTLGNIIQELARMAAMRAFQSIIGGSSGSVLTSIFGFANGGVFQGGRVKAFAKGGVVDSPTMFPMKGATGLMGEAGPEAIIPLKRGRDGSLGVQGGMTNAVSVTYAPQISVKGSGEEVAALRQEIARMNAEAPARIISTIQKAQKKRVL
jgi:phage-related minor tail protein